MTVPKEALEGSGAAGSNTLGEAGAPPRRNPIEIAILVTGDVKSSASTDMLLPGLNNCALMCFEVCHSDL